MNKEYKYLVSQFVVEFDDSSFVSLRNSKHNVRIEVTRSFALSVANCTCPFESLLTIYTSLVVKDVQFDRSLPFPEY